MKGCIFPGCDRPAVRLQRTHCMGHYTQRRRGYELSALKAPKVTTPLVERDGQLVRICDAVGCDKPGKKGTGRYCSKHSARVCRHGDPEAFIPPKERRLPRGPAHPAWTETPNYNATHQRLKKWFGRAQLHTCPCGETAQQWAYIGARSAHERLPFGDVSQYQPMCIPCHKRMDLALIHGQAS